MSARYEQQRLLSLSQIVRYAAFVGCLVFVMASWVCINAYAAGDDRGDGIIADYTGREIPDEVKSIPIGNDSSIPDVPVYDPNLEEQYRQEAERLGVSGADKGGISNPPVTNTGSSQQGSNYGNSSAGAAITSSTESTNTDANEPATSSQQSSAYDEAALRAAIAGLTRPTNSTTAPSQLAKPIEETSAAIQAETPAVAEDDTNRSWTTYLLVGVSILLLIFVCYVIVEFLRRRQMRVPSTISSKP
jgi:hypothetical protein